MGDLNFSLEDFIMQEEMKEVNIAQTNEVSAHGYESFSIKNDEQANIYLKLLSKIQHEESIIRAEAKDKLEKYEAMIKTWEESKLKEALKNKAFYTMLLEKYITQKRDNKKGTEKFLYGKISITQPQDKYEYAEDDKIAEELRAIGRNDLVKEKVVISKTELKKAGKKNENNNLVIDGHVITSVKITKPDMEVKINPVALEAIPSVDINETKENIAAETNEYIDSLIKSA